MTAAERYPGAVWAPLVEASSHGSYEKTQLIVHSTGTTASAAANRRYFDRADVAVESTFIVDYDGGVLQVMPASARADANGDANRRAISVETVGLASEPFTEQQVAALVGIGRWAVEEHPIARRVIPTSTESGIGWHVMFGAPGPWTSVRGKECPGPARIAQVRDRIIPAVAVRPTPVLAKGADVEFAYESDDRTLVGYSPAGKRRVEDGWEVGFWQRKGLLATGSTASGHLVGVERAAQSPDLARLLGMLPYTEPVA